LQRLLATAKSAALGYTKWRRYVAEKPLTIVVLGMHRSGTSCVTRMINLAGASLGVDSIPTNPWNKDGFWEAALGLEINAEILHFSGGHWSNPPPALRMNQYLGMRMRLFLGKLHAEGTAVWKDPRTVLTFPVWKPMLQNYFLVSAFRHPLSVAHSLGRRNQFSVEKGVALWREYNERLLATCADPERVHWIDFDRGLEGLCRAMRGIASACGLNYDPAVMGNYSPELRTSDRLGGELDGRTEAVYSRLLERAQRCSLAEMRTTASV
jgi:hypothetical protein